MLHDPLFAALEGLARHDEQFLLKVASLVHADKLFYVEFKKDCIICHLTDEALEAYYDHQ